jgi:hypothetical protein
LLLNYCKTYEDHLKENSPVFVELCLPGLGEDFKVSVFIHMEKKYPLSLIMVVEEHTPKMMGQFEMASEVIFKELEDQKLSLALARSENYMFEMTNMKELECIIFHHTGFKQFQSFNMDFRDRNNTATISILYELEKLYNQWHVDKNKQRIKTVDGKLTYLLMVCP